MRFLLFQNFTCWKKLKNLRGFLRALKTIVLKGLCFSKAYVRLQVYGHKKNSKRFLPLWFLCILPKKRREFYANKFSYLSLRTLANFLKKKLRQKRKLMTFLLHWKINFGKRIFKDFLNWPKRMKRISTKSNFIA